MRYVGSIVLVGCLGAGCGGPANREETPWVHVLKRSDVVGVDPITRRPVSQGDKTFTEEELVNMTLLKIVREHELVAKLEVFDRYFGDVGLSESQRRNADRAVSEWPDKDKEAYYRAAGIVIQTIKEINPGMSFEWLLSYGREITLPDPSVF